MDRSVILRRRIVAITAAVAATVLIYVLLFGGGGSGSEDEIELTIAQLTPETEARLAGLESAEKVDQLILAADPTEDAGTLGGVLVGSEAWTGAGTGKALTNGLRDAADGEIPTMLGTTQEGGNYRELPDLPPSKRPIEIGDAGDPAGAEAWAGEMAEALEQEGFDFNIGPLADIASLDSAIADRSFSDDPATVSAMTAAAYAGCAEAKLACIPGHFPGEGVTTERTEVGPASVSIDQATLLDRDVPPFEAAFAAGAPAVLVSNAFYAAYDPVTPASLSHEILDDLLRRQLGYEGVAISGDLLEGAIRAGYPVDAAAVEAIVNGADMVQLSEPETIQRVRAALLAAVESGEIGTDRLDSAAGRVLEMKQGLGLLG